MYGTQPIAVTAQCATCGRARSILDLRLCRDCGRKYTCVACMKLCGALTCDSCRYRYSEAWDQLRAAFVDVAEKLRDVFDRFPAIQSQRNRKPRKLRKFQIRAIDARRQRAKRREQIKRAA